MTLPLLYKYNSLGSRPSSTVCLADFPASWALKGGVKKKTKKNNNYKFCSTIITSAMRLLFWRERGIDYGCGNEKTSRGENCDDYDDDVGRINVTRSQLCGWCFSCNPSQVPIPTLLIMQAFVLPLVTKLFIILLFTLWHFILLLFI